MGISEGRIYEERSGKGFSDARAIKIAGAMGSIKRLVDNPWDYESIKRRVLLRILAILNLKMLGLEDFPKFRKTDSLQDILDLTVEACEVGELKPEFRRWIQTNFGEIARITGLDDLHRNDMI